MFRPFLGLPSARARTVKWIVCEQRAQKDAPLRKEAVDSKTHLCRAGVDGGRRLQLQLKFVASANVLPCIQIQMQTLSHTVKVNGHVFGLSFSIEHVSSDCSLKREQRELERQCQLQSHTADNLASLSSFDTERQGELAGW